MPRVRTSVPLLVLSLLLTAIPVSGAIIFPPPEDAWDENQDQREDPRPLEVYNLAGKPTIDGSIDPGEWEGATAYEVRDPGSDDPLGTLYAGLSDGFLYVANDWTVNTDPDPLNGGGNAWRFGTSTGQGAQNSGNGLWYEVYVQENGDEDITMAREADDEDSLEHAAFRLGAEFGISAGANFNGENWQYELFLGQVNPGPGPLPPCWHWEWRQLDPAPGDGIWLSVYDGSVHNNMPEPCTLALLALGALGLGARARRRRKQ